MLRVVELLKEKNHFLEKFCSLTENEMVQFSQGNFDSLEYFYQTREDILSSIKYVDESIENLNQQTANQNVSKEIKDAVQVQIKIKNQYVSKIMTLDLEVLSCIEEAKSSIIRELQNLKKNKKAISGYKSGSAQRRLDEEL